MKKRAYDDAERLEKLKEINDEEMEHLAHDIDFLRNRLIDRFGSIACLAMTSQELKAKGPQLLKTSSML